MVVRMRIFRWVSVLAVMVAAAAGLTMAANAQGVALAASTGGRVAPTASGVDVGPVVFPGPKGVPLGARPDTAGYYGVHVYAYPYTYSLANTWSTVMSQLYPENWLAWCWVYGEEVTDFGYTNDIWIALASYLGNGQWGTEYMSAIYASGDERGNLPVSATC